MVLQKKITRLHLTPPPWGSRSTLGRQAGHRGGGLTGHEPKRAQMHVFGLAAPSAPECLDRAPRKFGGVSTPGVGSRACPGRHSPPWGGEGHLKFQPVNHSGGANDMLPPPAILGKEISVLLGEKTGTTCVNVGSVEVWMGAGGWVGATIFGGKKNPELPGQGC